MAKSKWNEITFEDVIQAIHIFESEKPAYPPSRFTFLLYNGKKYPAKHIRGMAYYVHFREEISKEAFAGGKETVRFFSRLGFETQYNAESKIESEFEIEPQELKKKSKNKEKNKLAKPFNKIVIPTKDVIAQKNALQLLLNKLCDGDIVCEKTYSWMKTPATISNEYKNLYNALCSYRHNENFAKKNVSLRCDFVCESKKLIIEYDERQHFSEARRIALQSYPEAALNFDRNLWIKACQDTQAKDNSPADRDETRAFYDSVRDIEAGKHGYTLIRIMHGQIDFQKDEAMEYLKKILFDEKTENKLSIPRRSIKIGLYLQTDEFYGDSREFYKVMDKIQKSEIDILVFPEDSYVPFAAKFYDADFFEDADLQQIYHETLKLSQSIGKAVVICLKDRYDTIMSVYANAFASASETKHKNYIKHTATGSSACELENYPQYAEEAFQPIIYKGFRIGMTICYDCNHPMFSRKYAENKIDIILNSTGGDVRYDKWYKYNKVRAIENNCFTFVTMGGSEKTKGKQCCVYGFTPVGKLMQPTLLNGKYAERKNLPGEIYIYDTAADDGSLEIDPSINQRETSNKYGDLAIPIAGFDTFIRNSDMLTDNIRVLKHGDKNIIICFVAGNDILKPEKVLKLLYAEELKKIPNKKYIIYNYWESVDMNFYQNHLSVILKVRSMENYCAVILASDNINKCYQCTDSRAAQVVKAENEQWHFDTSRTGGPETIWKNKSGMKASWRKNIEWLISTM